MDDLGRLRWGVLALLVVLAVASAGWGLARNRDFEGAALNLGTELVGAALTYALFELVIECRERLEAEKEAIEKRKADLIAQMGSAVNDKAVAAAEELARQGWLYDGSLQGAQLSGANLEKADLAHAKLQGAFLDSASLVHANLTRANLADANLFCTDLAHATLHRTKLQRVRMLFTNLERANLDMANLEQASLLLTNLEHASMSVRQLGQALTLEGATLPDGTRLSQFDWQAEFDEWLKKKQEEEKETSQNFLRLIDRHS